MRAATCGRQAAAGGAGGVVHRALCACCTASLHTHAVHVCGRHWKPHAVRMPAPWCCSVSAAAVQAKRCALCSFQQLGRIFTHTPACVHAAGVRGMRCDAWAWGMRGPLDKMHACTCPRLAHACMGLALRLPSTQPLPHVCARAFPPPRAYLVLRHRLLLRGPKAHVRGGCARQLLRDWVVGHALDGIVVRVL